jgi:hypothetical protein
LGRTSVRVFGFAAFCLLRKPEPGFRHLEEEGLVGWILRILSKPNALACVPAIIFSRRHAAVSPPFGPWRFNFLVPNWFHLGEFTDQRLWAACPPDVPPEPPVSGRLQVQHIRVTQRKENSTNGRSSRYVLEHPPARRGVRACEIGFLQPRQVTLPGGAA